MNPPRSPISPRMLKKAAIDALTCNLVDGVRPAEAAYETTQIPMKKAPDAPADVVDMADFTKLDTHTRETLNIDRDPLKLALSFKVEIERASFPDSPLKFNITNSSALYAIRREFEKMSIGEIESTPSITVTVTKKEILSLYKPAPKRKGKHLNEEKATRELSVILYGEGVEGHQHMEASWTEEADYFMAKHPVCLSRALLPPTPFQSWF